MTQDDLARKLFTFYTLWGNEDKKKVVNVLAKQYAGKPEDLNQILRNKYRGTDLSSTATEIARQKMRSLTNQKSRSMFSAMFSPVASEPALKPSISAGFELSAGPVNSTLPSARGSTQMQLYASPPSSPMSSPSIYATPGRALGLPSPPIMNLPSAASQTTSTLRRLQEAARNNS